MSEFLKPLLGIANMIVSLINGLIVGAVTFVINLLDGLDSVDSLLEHAISSISGFFEAFLNLGTKLFPFLPEEWSAILHTTLIVLVVGLIIKKKVIR